MNFTKFAQITAVSMSLLCTIHCLAMPIIITLFSVTANQFDNPLIEACILIPASVIAGYNLYAQYKVHLKPLPIYVLLAALVALSLGLLIHIHWLILIGSIALAGAQILSWYFRKNTTIPCC